MESPQRSLNRRHMLGGGLGMGLIALPAGLNAEPRPYGATWLRTQTGAFPLTGKFVQGGYAIGKTAPNREISIDGVATGLSATNGLFVIGFDRDALPTATVTVQGVGRTTVSLDKTAYDIQRVNGLPADQVSPTDPALLERIARERDLKAKGFASREDATWFADGFHWPLRNFVVSGRFGNQRILNGEPKSPHYGFDMAAPEGTPVYAPQTARVALAEPDLHFEGGLILLDHGQGLISMYLHLSSLAVQTGEQVHQGQMIGQVGKKGRATGPHLCWRLKWRDRALDPSLWVR
ncbi:MAG: M23 family metallopeptidase [Asticcacaulis sp.]